MTGTLEDYEFAVDAPTTMLVLMDAGASFDLWKVTYADGEPIAAAFISAIVGNTYPGIEITPDGSAALWLQPSGGPAGASLRMATLEPEPAPWVELATDVIGTFGIEGDKLFYVSKPLDEPENQAWLVPLDDLLAAPSPGPAGLFGGDWSADGRYFCQNNEYLSGDVQLFEFEALGFTGPTVISSEQLPGSMACLFPRNDVALYGNGPGAFGPKRLVMVDLSGDQPGPPLPATTLAANEIQDQAVSPGAQWLAVVANGAETDHIEVTDISGTTPGTPIVLLGGLDQFASERILFVDDQHLLFTGSVVAEEQDKSEDLYLVDLSVDPPSLVVLDVGKTPTHAAGGPFAITPDGNSVLFGMGPPKVARRHGRRGAAAAAHQRAWLAARLDRAARGGRLTGAHHSITEAMIASHSGASISGPPNS